MTSPEPGPWLWVIKDDGGQVLDHGHQWTGLLSPARAVAEERIAVWAYPRILAGRLTELTGVVCHVRRAGETGRPATARADVWIRRLSARLLAV